MSARYRSRWLSAAALLAATGLASAQSPPPAAAPQPAVLPLPRLFVEPLLLEQEQVSEHCQPPRPVLSPLPAPAPHAMRCPAVPECQTAPEEVMLRCLLFSIHPLAAFLPIEFGQTELPPASYLEHPPQYYPPSPQIIELLDMPQEVEHLDVMPVEVEQLKVMPAAEESELKYQLLGPWTESAQLLSLPLLPLAEIKVGVREARTGSFCFGISAEVSRTGTMTVCAEAAPAEKKADADSQVMLNLLVAEVDRKGARALKLDRTADGAATRWVIEDADEARQKALEAGLDGLRRKGHAKVLAEPRLVTRNGQPASFLSGGEQAMPTPDGAVQFEEFGTKINCRPTVLADGTIHLDIEPEISELCDTDGVKVQGAVVSGRSSQRLHTIADIAPGHTLLISGPQAGGSRRLVVLVTPSVITPLAATGAAVQTPERRTTILINQSEHFGPVGHDTDNRRGGAEQPSHLTPERVHGGVGQDEASVHDLLEKCQREVSRGHYAAAEDLAQQALARDRKQVEADPLVCQSNLLQRVKAGAVLPLGSVPPGGCKPEGRRDVAAGEPKAIGSDERMVAALMQEYDAAFKEGRYLDAAALAERALQIDPNNAVTAAAVTIAMTQAGARHSPALPQDQLRWQAADALLSFQHHFRQGRYEEAKEAALQALTAAPGEPRALAALQMASAALSRQPHPAEPAQCPYVGPTRPLLLQPADPAVVGALRKLLIDPDKGGAEEAEPRPDGSKPTPRR